MPLPARIAATTKRHCTVRPMRGIVAQMLRHGPGLSVLRIACTCFRAIIAWSVDLASPTCRRPLSGPLLRSEAMRSLDMLAAGGEANEDQGRHESAHQRAALTALTRWLELGHFAPVRSTPNRSTGTAVSPCHRDPSSTAGEHALNSVYLACLGGFHPAVARQGGVLGCLVVCGRRDRHGKRDGLGC